MMSLYRYSRRGGSGDAVRSEMKTMLNDVAKVWVSIAQSAEHQSANLTIWVRFPAETLIFASFESHCLRVSVTSSNSFINPPACYVSLKNNNINNNKDNNNFTKKTPCGIQITKRCLPQPVTCTNRLNTLHKRTG